MWRVHTHYFKDGSYAELGAMRVPITHDYTHYYISEMGLHDKLITFINNVKSGFWDIHGVVTRQTTEGVTEIYDKYRLSGFFRDPANMPSGGAIFGFLQNTTINGLTEEEKTMMFDGVAARRTRRGPRRPPGTTTSSAPSPSRSCARRRARPSGGPASTRRRRRRRRPRRCAPNASRSPADRRPAGGAGDREDDVKDGVIPRRIDGAESPAYGA
jgi:hypothetical protein